MSDRSPLLNEIERLKFEIERLQSENFRLNEIVQHRFHDAVASDVAVIAIEDHEAIKAKLSAWCKLQPDLDRLSSLLGTCEGVNPIPVAMAAIASYRGRVEGHAAVIKRLEAEIARLRRALDAAGIVLESDNAS